MMMRFLVDRLACRLRCSAVNSAAAPSIWSMGPHTLQRKPYERRTAILPKEREMERTGVLLLIMGRWGCKAQV